MVESQLVEQEVILNVSKDENIKIAAGTDGKFVLTLVKGDDDLASIQMSTDRTSALAGTMLQAACNAFIMSGKPNPWPTKEEIAEYTVISPSGYNVGPGRISGSQTLMFYFGDSILGISLPHKELRTLGQRLMTVGADEGRAQ
jgi:hypothetical protein